MCRLVHHKRRLNTDKASESGVAAFKFLHDQAVLDIGHACAAVAVKIRAEKPQFTHQRYQFTRETALAEAVFNDWNEVVLDEGACRVAYHALIFIEQRIEFEEVYTLELEAHLLCLSMLHSNAWSKTLEVSRWQGWRGRLALSRGLLRTAAGCDARCTTRHARNSLMNGSLLDTKASVEPSKISLP